jgi:predicted ATPase
MYGGNAETHAPELADHFAEAEVLLGSDKMIHYSIIAGEKALRELAFDDAASHFERALETQVGDAIDDVKARTLHGYGVA